MYPRVLQFQLLCRRLRAPSPQCNELFYFYEQSIDSRIERGADRWLSVSSKVLLLYATVHASRRGLYKFRWLQWYMCMVGIGWKDRQYHSLD
jgi:hypothetical protein